jgi:hypothetical protein
MPPPLALANPAQSPGRDDGAYLFLTLFASDNFPPGFVDINETGLFFSSHSHGWESKSSNAGSRMQGVI